MAKLSLRIRSRRALLRLAFSFASHECGQFRRNWHIAPIHTAPVKRLQVMTVRPLECLPHSVPRLWMPTTSLLNTASSALYRHETSPSLTGTKIVRVVSCSKYIFRLLLSFQTSCFVIIKFLRNSVVTLMLKLARE